MEADALQVGHLVVGQQVQHLGVRK